MSRDLTCNETMPALDDGDSITDVRRMIPSRIISQQPFTNLMTNRTAPNNNNNSAGTATNMTVRDVVSSRIRNRGNEPIVSGLSSSINQTSVVASTSSSYMGKTVGISDVNTNNLLQSIFHETNRSIVNNQPTGKYINISLNNSNNIVSNQVSQQQSHQQQQHVLSQLPTTQQSAQSQPLQYIVSTTTIPTQRTQSSTTSLYRQQAPPATVPVDISSQSSQKIGISIAYDAAAIKSNATLSQPIVISNSNAYSAYVNNNGNSNAPATTVTIRTQPPAAGTISQGAFTGYIIPATSSSVDQQASSSSTSAVGGQNGPVYTNVIGQRVTESPGKSIYLSRQPNSSESPSPVVFMSGSGGVTASSHYLQQVHPPNRPISSYPPEMTVGSVVRAGASNNNNFTVTPTKPLISTVSGNGNNVVSSGLSRGASPYAVVMPRSESVLRESPNGLSNHGSTTPNGSQPPNSHSSPRPSILRGSSTARRFVERDATPVSSATNFAAVNFTDNNTQNVSSVNFYASNATSSSTSNDGIANDPRGDGTSNSQDDSPRKRQRKQQFDNSQLQDKLMMEVHADPRLEQIVTENSGLWKTGPIQSSMSKSPYNSAAEYAGVGGLAGREPRRRGRPRSVHRSNELLNHVGSSSQSPHSTPRILMNTTAHNISPAQSSVGSSSKMPGYSTLTNTVINPTVVAYGTAPPPSAGPIVSGDVSASINNVAPRSFMVDVDDRMLQVPPGSKRPRKYKKRTPELDPETGEPVKKPRKKGSGRKSKKDLLLLEAAKREIDIYGVDVANSPTIGEVLAKTSTSGSNQHNLAELQQHIYQQQLQQSTAHGHSSHSRYSTTYVNTTAVAIGNKTQQHYQQQQLSNHHQSKQQIVASTSGKPSPPHGSAAALLAEEQYVVSTLCRLRSRAAETAAGTGNDIIQNTIAKVESAEDNEQARRAADNSTNSRQDNRPANFPKNLLDAAKFCELSGLWKTADRNLASSLADDYDEVHEFLTNLRAERMAKKQQNGRWLVNDLREVCCPIFDSFEQFKNSLDSLKLLPTTCQYFKSSRTLIDSLRGNLYGFSAYHLAKTLIAADDAASSKILSKVDAKRAKSISSLRSTERRLQGKCEDLFDFLYGELKRRMNDRMNVKDGAINSAKEMLIDMSVVNLLDELTDTVDRISEAGVSSKEQSEHREQEHAAGSIPQFPNPLTTCVSPSQISSALRKLPPHYQNLLAGSSVNSDRRPNRPRRRIRRQCESSSESDGQLLDNKDGDSDVETSPEKKVEYFYQKLRELNDRAQKVHRLAKRQSLRILEQLEPSRYREFVDSTRLRHNSSAQLQPSAPSDEAMERLREDMETSFLMEIPSHKSKFKPLSIYNSTKSITMKPAPDMIRRIFKNIEVPCYSVEEADENCPRLKSPAVDRLKDAESNFLVLEEIREMELNSEQIVAIASERLQRKYGNRHHLPTRNGFIENHANLTDEESRYSSGVDDQGFLPHFADFNRSLQRRFPYQESEEAKLQYFNDRCQETHEMAAVFVGLSHSRANILHQCLESLTDVIKTKTASENLPTHCKPGLATAAQDSDMEVDAAANGAKATTVYDYDVDSPAGSHVSDNDSDQQHTSDEDEPDHLSRVKKRLNTHRNNFSVNSKNNSSNITTKKRRWSGYRRQTPTSSAQPPAVGGATAASRVALAK